MKKLLTTVIGTSAVALCYVFLRHFFAPTTAFGFFAHLFFRLQRLFGENDTTVTSAEAGAFIARRYVATV